MKKAKVVSAAAPDVHVGGHAEHGESRAKPDAGAKRGPGVVTDFGTQPQGTSHWKCRRVAVDGTKELLKAPSKTSGMGVEMFPLAELSPDTIRERWGAGTYEVEFLGPRKNKGTCVHLSWGRHVDIGGGRVRRAAPEPVPASVARVEAPAPDPFGMMAMVKKMAREDSEYTERQIDARLTGLASLAAVLSGNQQAAQQLAAQQQNTQLATILNGIVQRLDRIEAGAMTEEEEDDEDEEEEDDEDEEEEEEEEEEVDTLTKMIAFFDKHGPMIKMGLEYFAKNPSAVPPSLQESATNGAGSPVVEATIAT